MFQIGEFSRIGMVTIETLRHYDALGLLKPAKVDSITGYRYYTADQLQTLNRIMALKEVGFSLDEISRILQEGLNRDELSGMLKAQLVITESTLETAKLRRENILTRLNYLEMEEFMPDYEVTLKTIDPLTVASIREVVTEIKWMPERCGKMFKLIAGWLAGRQLPIGVPLTIYHNPSFTREYIDTECAFIIPDMQIDDLPVTDPPISIREMEAVAQAAATIATGDFYQKVEGLKPAYNAIGCWIEEHGYRIVGPPRELFYGSPDKGDLTAEIQFPVEKVE